MQIDANNVIDDSFVEQEIGDILHNRMVCGESVLVVFFPYIDKCGVHGADTHNSHLHSTFDDILAQKLELPRVPNNCGKEVGVRKSLLI
jgi:hypothetical protein